MTENFAFPFVFVLFPVAGPATGREPQGAARFLPVTRCCPRDHLRRAVPKAPHRAPTTNTESADEPRAAHPLRPQMEPLRHRAAGRQPHGHPRGGELLPPRRASSGATGRLRPHHRRARHRKECRPSPARQTPRTHRGAARRSAHPSLLAPRRLLPRDGRAVRHLAGAQQSLERLQDAA